jgi:drug/metabolite transporter (DMT)-like permease
MTDNARGALMMALGMAAFTFSDAVMKLIGQSLPLFQAVLMRGVLVSALFMAIAWRAGALVGPVAPRDRGLMALRVVAEAMCAWFFFLALFNMPLANVIAIFQALPLAIVAAGAIFFGERVGWRRWLMIALGFVGVLMIVRPGTEGFDRFSVYALLSVAAVTVRDLATRRMSRGVPSLRVAFWSAFGVTLFAAAGSLTEDWVPPDGRLLGLLALGAGFILGGYLMSIMAVRHGELAVVTPFRYTGLVWALLLGWFVFGDWPDGMTLAGAAVIVATGLYTLWRERQLGVAARAAAAAAGSSGP